MDIEGVWTLCLDSEFGWQVSVSKFQNAKSKVINWNKVTLKLYILYIIHRLVVSQNEKGI